MRYWFDNCSCGGGGLLPKMYGLVRTASYGLIKRTAIVFVYLLSASLLTVS